MKDNANRPAPAANGEAAKFFDCEGTARRGPNTADPGSQAAINLESDLLTLESGLHSLESGVLDISPSGSFQFSGGGPESAPELSSDLSELVRAAEPKGGLTDALNRFAAADSVAFGPPPPPIHPSKSANPPSVRGCSDDSDGRGSGGQSNGLCTLVGRAELGWPCSDRRSVD
jgi:hypothetical protein